MEVTYGIPDGTGHHGGGQGSGGPLLGGPDPALFGTLPDRGLALPDALGGDPRLWDAEKGRRQSQPGAGELPEEIGRAIIQAAEEVIAGKLDDHFPLVVFQTGSGTQTNMNVNEVIANRASEILGKPLGSKYVHPNDHVNRGQSSNDTFPTAMYVATALALHQHLYPAVEGLIATLEEKARAFDGIVKVGRTHLMDAVPITLGQEVGSWAAQLRNTLAMVKEAEKGLYHLAIGAPPWARA